MRSDETRSSSVMADFRSPVAGLISVQGERLHILDQLEHFAVPRSRDRFEVSKPTQTFSANRCIRTLVHVAQEVLTDCELA